MCAMSSNLRSAWRYAADFRFRAFTRRRYPGKVLRIQKFHFGHCFLNFSPDRSTVFGLVMRCHVNARPISKNMLPFSPLALTCKRDLSRVLLFTGLDIGLPPTRPRQIMLAEF